MKKGILAILCFVLVVTLMVPKSAYARDAQLKSEILPCWKWTDTIATQLNISDSGRSEVRATVTSSKADGVKIIARLQQYDDRSWSTLKTWSKTEKKPAATLSGVHYVKRGYSYRLYVTYYIYSEGELKETIVDIDYGDFF